MKASGNVEPLGLAHPHGDQLAAMAMEAAADEKGERDQLAVEANNQIGMLASVLNLLLGSEPLDDLLPAYRSMLIRMEQLSSAATACTDPDAGRSLEDLRDVVNGPAWMRGRS